MLVIHIWYNLQNIYLQKIEYGSTERVIILERVVILSQICKKPNMGQTVSGIPKWVERVVTSPLRKCNLYISTTDVQL